MQEQKSNFFVNFRKNAPQFPKAGGEISLYKPEELLYNIMAKEIYGRTERITMALIEYDVYKQKLRDLEPELEKLGQAPWTLTP